MRNELYQALLPQEPKYAQQLLLLESISHHYPYLEGLIGSFSQYPELFWHGLMVASVYEKVFSRLLSQNMIDANNGIFLDTLTPAALLHDFGKLGVSSEGINSSLAVFNHNGIHHNQVSEADQRLEVTRAIQNLHPLLSGYAVVTLAKTNVIPKDMASRWVAAVFSHEENNSPYKTSYPRTEYRFQEPIVTLGHLLLQGADIAVAMRELRSYRNWPLPFITIWQELSQVCLTDKPLEHILPLFNLVAKEPQTVDMKGLITNLMVQTVASIDLLVRQVPSVSSISSSRHIDLDFLFKNVWQQKEARLTAIINASLQREYNHQTRMNQNNPQIVV